MLFRSFNPSRALGPKRVSENGRGARELHKISLRSFGERHLWVVELGFLGGILLTSLLVNII